MIRTVLGDIEKQQTGNVLMHEHISCVSNDMLMAFGKKWLDEAMLEEYSVAALQKLKPRIDLGIFVDGTAIDLGRNVGLLKRISERTGIYIVASTGLYYYPSMLTVTRSAEDLAEWFLYECENGMEGTNIRPGILKCAADGNEMTEDMKKRVSSLAIVQKQTGLPLYAHCSHQGSIAYEMLKVFEEKDANPQKIILGHASRRLDADYLEALLREGYYICIDQSFDGDEAKVTDAVYRLCEKGYEKKLLFSHDNLFYNDFSTPAPWTDFPETALLNRYSFLSEKLVPQLKEAGISKKQCIKFLRDNALDVLDF